MVFSHSQKVLMAISRVLSGSFSLVASSIIVYKIYRRFKKSRTSGADSRNFEVTTYHRMLLGISFLDILFSFGSLGGTFVVPASTGVVFGHGTTATCSTQGFLLQTGAALPVYVACLNIYFMIKIRYNVNDTILRRRYEPWLHGIPIAFSFSSATLGVALKIFNPINIPEMGCWVAPYPRGCSIKGHCTRGYKIGERLDLYVWVFAYGWFFASFLVVAVSSLLIYTAIRGQERRNSLYLGSSLQGLQPPMGSSALDPDSSSRKNDWLVTRGATDEGKSPDESTSQAVDSSQAHEGSTKSMDRSSEIASRTGSQALRQRSSGRLARASRVAAVQSGLYCTATFMRALWSFVPWLGWKVGAPTKVRVFYAFMSCFVAHLQGVFNLYIFVRLQFNHLRKTERDWSWLKCVLHCLTSPAANK
jgi:hypothetical protein